MNSRWTKVLLLLFLGAQCACVDSADAVRLETGASTKKEASVEELIGNYRQWTRVNPTPAVIQALVAAACAPVTSMGKGEGPHSDKFITVYVNEAGRKAMMEMLNPEFPQGSIILKEKLTTRDSTAPELLTVMMKREAGFNPKNGDWEFMVMDGAGKQVQERGRLENCQSCHATVSSTDFVYRNYLPPKVREELR